MIVSSGLISHHPATVFRRPSGFSLWTAGILLRGSAVYSVGGHERRVRSPSFQLIAPGTSYTLSPGDPDGPWVEAWAVFEPRASWTRSLLLPELLPGLRSFAVPGTPLGRQVLRSMVEGIRLALRSPQWRREIAENTLERVLIGTQLLLDESPRGNDNSVDERIRLVDNAIRMDLRHAWSVSEMADLAHLSPSRFAHLFARQMGAAPREHLDAVRMERARELLLSTNYPIQLVSEAVGFRDALHFSARFKARHGASPTRFRLDPSGS